VTGAVDGALLCEIASALDAHGELHCGPSIETADGVLTLVVRVRDDGQNWRALELREDLQRVIDAAQIRLFALRYGIDGLAAMLPRKEL